MRRTSVGLLKKPIKTLIANTKVVKVNFGGKAPVRKNVAAREMAIAA